MKTGILAFALLATWTTPATPATSDRVERHSGRVVTVDRLRDMVVVDEVGSWDPATERASVTRNRIHITVLTEFKIFLRTPVAGRNRGDFAEIPLRVANVFPGDTVTAECVRAGNRLVALSIILAEPF